MNISWKFGFIKINEFFKVIEKQNMFDGRNRNLKNLLHYPGNNFIENYKSQQIWSIVIETQICALSEHSSKKCCRDIFWI